MCVLFIFECIEWMYMLCDCGFVMCMLMCLVLWCCWFVGGCVCVFFVVCCVGLEFFMFLVVLNKNLFFEIYWCFYIVVFVVLFWCVCVLCCFFLVLVVLILGLSVLDMMWCCVLSVMCIVVSCFDGNILMVCLWMMLLLLCCVILMVLICLLLGFCVTIVCLKMWCDWVWNMVVICVLCDMFFVCFVRDVWSGCFWRMLLGFCVGIGGVVGTSVRERICCGCVMCVCGCWWLIILLLNLKNLVIVGCIVWLICLFLVCRISVDAFLSSRARMAIRETCFWVKICSVKVGVRFLWCMCVFIVVGVMIVLMCCCVMLWWLKSCLLTSARIDDRFCAIFVSVWWCWMGGGCVWWCVWWMMCVRCWWCVCLLLRMLNVWWDLSRGISRRVIRSSTLTGACWWVLMLMCKCVNGLCCWGLCVWCFRVCGLVSVCEICMLLSFCMSRCARRFVARVRAGTTTIRKARGCL